MSLDAVRLKLAYKARYLMETGTIEHVATAFIDDADLGRVSGGFMTKKELLAVLRARVAEEVRLVGGNGVLNKWEIKNVHQAEAIRKEIDDKLARY
jgi:hypothetical protein